jgi:RNA polymerase-associated protein RTF1
MKLKVKIKDRKASKAMSDKIRESEEEEKDQESDASDERPKRAGRKKQPSPVKGTKKKTAAQRRKEQQEAEEGEVGSDDSKAEFDDGLDEDLIGDDADRKKLEKMTEREREEELFKRAEIREVKRKRFEITKKLKQQQKLTGGDIQKKKKLADVSDDDDDDQEEGQVSDDNYEEDEDLSKMLDTKERSQDRRKNLDALKFDKKSSALNELKARKEEKERKERERRERKDQEQEDKENKVDSRGRKKKSRRDSSSDSDSGSQRRRSSSSSSSRSAASSRSGDSAGDSDTDRFKDRQGKKKVQKYVETQEELEPIRLSRHKMERFVHLPIFKRLVVGCFVRIGIGQNQGRSVYRCTEITDVVETAKIYQVGKAKTNAGLKLKFGKQERVFRLEFISNSPLMPSEFEKWKYTLEESGQQLPTKDFVSAKEDEIKKALTYEYSSADVDAIIERKGKFNKNPTNYAMLKAKLMKDKEVGLAEGTDVSEIDTQLNDLEHRAELLDKRRTEKSSISAISFINNRNRKHNVQNAELAIYAEIKRTEEEGTEDSPFQRRRCNPRMVTKKEEGAEGGPLTSAMLKKMAEDQAKEREMKSKDVRSEIAVTFSCLLVLLSPGLP